MANGSVWDAFDYVLILNQCNIELTNIMKSTNNPIRMIEDMILFPTNDVGQHLVK